MRVLVVSHAHGLLPLAWRLRREGADVAVYVVKERYRRCWDGLLEKVEGEDAVLEAALGAVVVTDSHYWTGKLESHPQLYGQPRGEPLPPGVLRLGAWWTGQALVLPHWLAADWGAWPGGMGPRVEGATALWTGPQVPGWPETLAGQGPGLWRANVVFDAEGKLEVGPWSLGWDLGHTHAFLAWLADSEDGLAGLLKGGEPWGGPGITLVVPVSVPPWPGKEAAARAGVEVPAAVLKGGQVMWHDFRMEEGRAVTAGTDGLVGVVRASGRTWRRVRGEVVQRAGQLAAALPEAQWRPDAGQAGELVEAMLDARGLLG